MTIPVRRVDNRRMLDGGLMGGGLTVSVSVNSTRRSGPGVAGY
jgi:hypothetical protein